MCRWREKEMDTFRKERTEQGMHRKAFRD